MTVCLAEDDFTRSRWLTDVRWSARLSDGTVALQDDGRPGVTRSAWLRLADHVRARRLRVEALWLSFRGEPPIPLPEHADGYFFRTALGALLCGEAADGFYLPGYLAGGVVRVRRYKVPELLLCGEECRDPTDPDAVGPSLIMNY